MSYQMTFYCDGCKQPRKEGNHWLMAVLMRGFLGVRKWDDALSVNPRVMHFCTQACFHKRQNEHLQPESGKEEEGKA